MTIELSDDVRKMILQAIQRHVGEQLGQEIGVLQSQLLLDFMLKLVGAAAYNQAISEQYDYYSPSNWQEASDALVQAKNIAQENPDNQEILKLVYVVDRRLESAQYIKNSVQKTYNDLFVVQRMLVENQAAQSYEKEYQQVELQLKQHIRDYENLTLGRNKETVSQRSVSINAYALLSNMQKLNIQVVKFNFLHLARQDLAQLEQLDVKSIAPTTYQEALNALTNANQFIENNVHDIDGIQKVADAFRFAVDHVTHVTQAVVALSKKDIIQLEEVVLRLPDLTLDSGELKLHVGDSTLRLLATPGHTEDTIAAFVEETRVLLASDTVMPVPVVIDGDLETLKSSLLKLLDLRPESIVQGHGEVILRGEVQAIIKRNISYLDAIWDLANKAASSGDRESLYKTNIEKFGLSRVALDGRAEELHTANLIALYDRLAG